MGDELELSEHAPRTRTQWNADAPDWVASGPVAWQRGAPDCGMWAVPEDEARILPNVRGLDVIDIGSATTASTSRSSTRARRRRRFPKARSTSCSPSTARRSGATRTTGSRRRTGCCGRAAA